MYMIFPSGNTIQKPDQVFTTAELKSIFGGWFYLRSLHRIGGIDYYYMCTQDLHEVPRKDWPELNKEATELAGVPIYGKALVAPDVSFLKEIKEKEVQNA